MISEAEAYDELLALNQLFTEDNDINTELMTINGEEFCRVLTLYF